MQPYFYKIQHVPTGKYYVGIQYGKTSDPYKFWKTYFTSSKYVKNLIECDGVDSFIIVNIQIRDDARMYEHRYLKKAYNLLGKSRFLEAFLNRNIAPGILLSDEIISKANIKRRVSNSISAKKLFAEGRHNFQIKNSGELEHVRKLRSERMLGNNFGSKREMTADLKEKLAKKSTGNTNVRGKKWWTDGVVNRRSFECPGEKFRLGTKRNK
jgi:hypothetical protein